MAVTSAAAQDSVRAPSAPPATTQPTVGPPIRRISTASAVSKEKLGSVTSVRELPDGRVLVNDGASRRLILMDTMLVTERIVLDSLSEKENTYGTRQGTLLAHRGDSSLFIDPNSLALLVIDPQANITRVRSVPRAQDVYLYTSTGPNSGIPSTDDKGRLVFRMYAQPTPPATPPPKGVPYFPQEPDSSFIVAMDLETRRLDTLGSIRIPKSEFTVRMSPNGGFSFYNNINPLPMTDDWAMLPDGTIALVRGIDYRVDYRNPDGSWTSSPKVPFDWQPMSDDDKQHLVDSVRNAQSKTLRTQYVTSMIRWVNTYNRKYPPNFSAPEGYVAPNGFAKNWNFPPGVKFPEKYIYACAPGEEPTVTPAPGGATSADRATVPAAPSPVMPMIPGMPGGPGPQGTPSCIPQPIPNLAQVPNAPTMREVSVISPKLLPDFRPPFVGGAVRADMEGNLWVRIQQAKPIPGGPVYDVINRQGQLVDRLQLPPGYTLVGFGRGKVVFVSMRDASGIHLARVRLR